VITLHIDTSTVVIGNKAFPACAVIPPAPDYEPDLSRWNRILGDPWTRWTPRADTSLGRQLRGTAHLMVYVPMENGALCTVSGDNRQPGYTVQLHHHTCVRSDDPSDPGRWLWMPADMMLTPSGITVMDRRHWRHRDGTIIWVNADEDWIAELIPRLAAKRVDPPYPPGPEAERVPLRALYAEFAHLLNPQPEGTRT
jgi:hypothetical protein